MARGEKPFRKPFADPQKAEDFAKAQAEQLAAGQVHAPAISITDAQTFREAQRRLGPVDVPLHVVAGEYADLMQQLGDNGTVRQAIEFFLHNAVRPDLIRPVSQVVEAFIATKTADGLSQVYLDDCAWRLAPTHRQRARHHRGSERLSCRPAALAPSEQLLQPRTE